MEYENYKDRLRKGLANYAKFMNNSHKLKSTLELLPKIIGLCGPASDNRKPALRIAETIIKSETIKIIAPCCPDYSHKNGVYDFKGLGENISLLGQNQISFLLKLRELGVEFDALFLYADQEAYDPKLLKIAGIDRETFLEKINGSVKETRKSVEKFGWRVCLMTELVPEFFTKEATVIQQLSENEMLESRITSETITRFPMYQKINPQIRFEEARQRTVRTAAQYLLLGEFARDNDFLISNHTTTNLAWYADAGTAILHNPVAIY